MVDLSNKYILFTGGFGFIGSALVKYISKTFDSPKIAILHHYKDIDDDLTNWSRCGRIGQTFSGIPIDIVFNLAGVTGNVKSHGLRPVDSFVDNTLMGLNVLRACYKYKVKKVVSIIASCAYPHCEWEKINQWGNDREYEIHEKEIMREHDLFDGPPDQSIEAHAYAKRNLQLASKYYNQQYGCDFVCVCPPTVYGPGDSFDPSKTKAMGSLIKRFCDAKRNNEQESVCWGSGSPLREFLYIDDCVRLLAQSVNYKNSEIPLNIGSGQEISIKNLAELIAKIVGYTGRIRWDSNEPEGQQRKFLDSSRMENILGKQTFIPLEEGIRRTVAWYEDDFYGFCLSKIKDLVKKCPPTEEVK